MSNLAREETMATAEQAQVTEKAAESEIVNTIVDAEASVAPRRYFTIPDRDPFDEIEWELRHAHIPGKDGPAFEQKDVEFPKFWSQTATNIVSQKYFRGRMASPERERSVKQMIGRVVDTIGGWGREGGYFATDEEVETFEAELKAILVKQYASFNSPVWFNVGFEAKPQCSACFILSIEDSMESILDWIRREGVIFRGGSGSGVNLSRLRSSKEQLSKGGYASGPVSFMRGADASAGTIKSGGKTRRAAKMVVLDVDHPDIDEFIWCKAKEERKARVLEAAGYDMSLDSPDWSSIQYQNANNSVRVTDAFMEAVIEGKEWNLTARTDGSVVETTDARDLLRHMAEAAWECADPGVQYDTTINSWHTLPNTSRINASNPCCFVGETLVDTEEGLLSFDELLERKVSGDPLPRVWSFATASQEPTLTSITNVWVAGVAQQLVEVTTHGGHVLRCTPEHRFLTEAGYIEAQLLEPRTELIGSGDEEILSPGALASLQRVVVRDSVAAVRVLELAEPVLVYDLEAAGEHNLTVGSQAGPTIVVHNSEYMSHRRQCVQPRLAEPHEVPPQGRRVRHRGLRARRGRRLPRAGDRRRLLLLSDSGDRQEREGLSPARARLREPRRAPDGARVPVRLRRGACVRGRDHGAHDRPRVPQVSRGREADGPVRGLPAERGGDDRRHREAPRSRRQHRPLELGAGRAAKCCTQSLG